MSKSTDRTTMVKKTTTVDYTTGEIKEEQEVTHIKKGVEPNYIKLYINTLLTFKDLPTTLNPILVEFLKYMSYADPEQQNGGQLLYINAHIKKQISQKLDMKINTLEKALTTFVKSKVFKRVGTGTFQVNPHLFGKGEWKDISAIRATFDFKTGEVTAEIEKEGEGEEKKNEQE